MLTVTITASTAKAATAAAAALSRRIEGHAQIASLRSGADGCTLYLDVTSTSEGLDAIN